MNNDSVSIPKKKLREVLDKLDNAIQILRGESLREQEQNPSY